MEKLSDFKPLQRLRLPGIGDLRCSGLTVIVGPNSAGKSQLLQDIFYRVRGEPREIVVAEEILIEKPVYAELLGCLESEGYLERFTDEGGNSHIRPLTTSLGIGAAINPIQPIQAENWFSNYVSVDDPKTKRRNEFLNYFGNFYVTGLFLDRRLNALNQVGTIDFETQAPQQDLHALYLNDGAREKLFSEVQESFGKAVWPDSSRGNLLCLRVSDEGVVPTAEERLSTKKMREFRTIETEGDGLKSYVATCVALLLGRRPVCVIDEPEMCLHPPQAYNLGRFIGKNGSSTDVVTFVATHSSQILRGVIQTSRDVQIVRLTRRGKDFHAHLVSAQTLAEAVAKPTVRAESVLDGIFAQSVVILEGDGDRLVYQTVWETLAPELRLDIHFAAVGGTGGITDTCKLYKALKIPVAIIADLDLIADNDKVKRLLEALAPTEAPTVFKEISNLMEEIRMLPPTTEPETVKKQLESILGGEFDWQKVDDVRIGQDLRRIAQSLDRMRRLKSGGVEGFSGPISERLKAAVSRLATFGIFLVPVGELECWLSAEGITESKSNKWAWANAASLTVQNKGVANGDIWDFIRNVGAYLQAENSYQLVEEIEKDERVATISAAEAVLPN